MAAYLSYLSYLLYCCCFKKPPPSLSSHPAFLRCKRPGFQAPFNSKWAGNVRAASKLHPAKFTLDLQKSSWKSPTFQLSIPVLKLLLVGVQKAVQVLQTPKFHIFVKFVRTKTGYPMYHVISMYNSDCFNKHI